MGRVEGRTVKLLIGFEGTHYEGWQSQKTSKTLQELFEKNLSRILKEKTNVISSSRTDSGVHAEGLVAHFSTQNTLPDKKIKDALNFYLPKDVVVFSAKTVSNDFHARYSAKSKVYVYEIWNAPTRPLFEAPFVLWFPHRLNLLRMKKAARHFIGRHDFSAFRDRGEKEKSAVREVRRLRIRKNKSMVQIEIEADGFLRHMVRIIVGTLIEAGRKKISPEAIPQMIRSKNRTQTGPTAKPHGLTLLKVKY